MPRRVACRRNWSLSPAQRALGQRWTRADGSTGAYASALALVQATAASWRVASTRRSRATCSSSAKGDEQHLMIWMGRYVAYHTST